ncbi:transferrin receptor-like dimerization domain-containing protein [Xanthomonas hortorum]|uniref:Folate hydrolase n=1 Tax=Xanthomonas hortorum pv. gardneri TaxID=2754056 RepID=A0A6V7ELJ8_9XANT|nr:transferrin receptor-like dimerization domain-containing protein [Xanthomonas hortorum]APP79370.1 folate hydrolase [Xanthomonas hortorum pv. gardneri]EGD19267.1 putative aminopeptidase [Xanthomonas hortorum ATCC 19865]KLA96879.1 folate hydrolase [Xanthomonas hortorum pv. gardneri]KLB02711.1 folate hydrolase [Xanthomonas hortorum pv. gardneri]KLB05996.1 folate hydrolase [Xanthomonas hortorum pv. gardneri]
MTSSQHAWLLALAFVAPTLAAQPAAQPAALPGYDADAAQAQRALEARFDSGLKDADYRGWLKQWSSAPNHVGSPHNLENARDLQTRLCSYGWDARIETFEVLWPSPKTSQLELLGAKPYVARLKEPPLPGDSTSSQTENVLPPYVIYGGNGDVTGDPVYVNYGIAEDYEALARNGVDVRGKIVIARYGKGWRGLKPRLAQEHGAIGAIIYSDPRDDGYFQDQAYPDGPARNQWSVQRGSVANFAIYPGDPLTPGVGASKGAKRLKIEQAGSVLKIPTLPISWGDAQPLLAALGGPVAPEDWRGALPITYRIGGDDTARVHLKVDAEWGSKTIYNVIATLRGIEYPDQWVVRGNHRDGWVFGAADPLSGTTALLAEAKAIGELAKQGQRPKRTLVYASWDGEEAGLLGSTEWAEQHADELRRKAVLYVNTDGNGRGFLNAGGSHALQRLVNGVAADLRDPDSGVSVLDRQRARARIDALAPTAKPAQKDIAKQVAAGGDVPLKALGSGSDYSPFLQHLGLSTLDLGYGGQGGGSGVYHSLYDSYDYFARYIDPDFSYLPLLSQTVGRTVLRVANAPVLPQRFGDFADAVAGYAQELKQQADSDRTAARTQVELLQAGAYAAVDNPNRPQRAPEPKAAVPQIDFAALDQAITRLQTSAKRYDGALASRGGSLDAGVRGKLNASLQRIDQTLLAEGGLPGRPWYRNLIYAPGLATGYEVKTLPGIREALEDRRWEDLSKYIAQTAAVLDRYREAIDRNTALIEG